ncbi:MAG: hypothetical protein VX589_06245 [Myxococcota bacterium]|nr:hypothetical protein [Myxococcota bacterium]
MKSHRSMSIRARKYGCAAMVALLFCAACGGSSDDEASRPLSRAADGGTNFASDLRADCSDGLDNDGDGLIDVSQDPGCENAQDPSEVDEVRPQCADDVDNDGDGLIDFGPDPGCDDFQDNDETDPTVLQCDDGIDNDGDGLIDTQDPGCPVRRDNDESDDPDLPACSDGIDNDGDGDIDHPRDRGCSAPEDTDESGDMMLNALPQCADQVDNDGDGLIDLADPGCRNADAPLEDGSDAVKQCSNGLDDDGNGQIDFPYDPGCQAAGDDEETRGDADPACSNAMDDDGDGFIDFPNDPGCSGAGDRDERDGNAPTECSDQIDNDDDGLIDWPDDLGCTSRGDALEQALCSLRRAAFELANGRPALGNTISGSVQFSGRCGGRGGAESVYFYRLDRRVDRLEISTAFEETTVDTVLYVRRLCAAAATEIACQAETVGDETAGQILIIENPAPGDYFIFVDTVTATPGTFKINVTEVPIAACRNRVDDDMDGKIDYPRDPGCTTSDDRSEDDPDEAPLCADEMDNDGDNLIDYPLDLGCRAASDNDEVDLCGQGVRFREFGVGQTRIRATTATPSGDECGEMVTCPAGDEPVPARCLAGLCVPGCNADEDCTENTGERCLDGACIENNRFEGTCGGTDLIEQVFAYDNPVNANITLTAIPLYEDADMANDQQAPSPLRNLVIYMRSDCDNEVDGMLVNTELACSDQRIGAMNHANPRQPDPPPRDEPEGEGVDDEQAPLDAEDALPSDAVRVTVEAVPPGTYFIFVDTKIGVGGPFELRVDVERLPAGCADQRDNDGDGFYDSDDLGCEGPEDESEADPVDALPDCSDGIDNDMDGLTDYPIDPGCPFRGGLSEDDPDQRPACSDGLDNDEDDWFDFPDEPGCNSAGDNDESDAERPQCRNAIDDDMDGLVDYPDDPGCAARGDMSEKNEEVRPACFDELDNDRDGVVDYPFDPGCRATGDNSEVDPAVRPACANGFDDDGDMKIDFPQEPGCASAGDVDETDSNFRPQCADTIDNDNNGLTDWPDDPGCRFAGDTREALVGAPQPRCSDGIDNDMDGDIDLADDGCVDARDNDESDPVDGHRCNDGLDNDEDGNIDWPDDGGCGARGASCEQAGYELCDGECEDLLNDVAHCGQCGRTCEDGVSCMDGVCGGLYTFEGIQLNTPEADLRGWEVCHRDRYDAANTSIRDILAQCAGQYVMLGCKQAPDANVAILAMGERDAVFFDVGPGEAAVNLHNGVAFYFHRSSTMGFAAAGSTVRRLPFGDVDNAQSQFRLSWRTRNDQLVGGFRCGAATNLQGRPGQTWERVIWTSP